MKGCFVGRTTIKNCFQTQFSMPGLESMATDEGVGSVDVISSSPGEYDSTLEMTADSNE
jgi:hypothetical protein